MPQTFFGEIDDKKGLAFGQQFPNGILNFGSLCRTNGGTSALAMIVRKIPNVLPKFEDMLDHATTLAEHDINDVDCELKLDFRVLIPNQSKGSILKTLRKVK